MKNELMNTETVNEVFGSPIFGYSRRMAIEDGLLVDCADPESDFAEVTRQHFKIPVAMTIGVFEIVEKAVQNPNWCNDFKGVWHDLCHMSKAAARVIDPTTRLFQCIIRGAGRKSVYTFKVVCGPGDQGEPVLTFMLPSED